MPVILKDKKAYARILHDIREQLPKSALDAKVQGNTLRIMPTSADSFLFVQNYLQQRNIFHTFTLPDEKELKIVIEGVPYTTPTAIYRLYK